MKPVLSLLLLSASSSSVYSIDNAEVLNFNLRHSANIEVQGPNNKHQCYNHCERHTSKSTQWIDNCKRQCDEQYDPPTGQCYNLGDSCDNDEECQTGGYNPCTKCGDEHGTEYYKRCYGGEEPAPTPAPEQCYNLGDSCDNDEDCQTGGYNPCTKCGDEHGTEYYKRCYGGDEEEDAEDIVVGFLETDEDSNGSKRQCYNDCEARYWTSTTVVICKKQCDQQYGPPKEDKSSDIAVGFLETNEGSDYKQQCYNYCKGRGKSTGYCKYKCGIDEDAVVEFLEDDGHGWDDIKNATEDGWDDTKKGTEQATKKTADWSKNAADKTKDKTFDDPDSSGFGIKSGTMLVAVGSLAMHALLV